MNFRRPCFYALTLISVCLSACNGATSIDNDALPAPKVTDHYRTAYEIMPYSFADSNNDKVGDLQGIIDKLDYIEDLGYDEIWMTPIFPAPTYHKYDATNYYDIDKEFGSLEIFDKLIEKAHEKGIHILLDLAINHSSDEHQWFVKSCKAHINGTEEDPYYSYYRILPIEEHQAGGAWHFVPGSNSRLVYEGQFYSGMPDFNLQSVLDDPDGYLATEFKKIISFWLKDHKADGFRLDAVTSYFTGDREKNLEFMTWLNNECRKVKPDCYLVGEGKWDGDSPENLFYQDSGVDSYFNFAHRGKETSASIPNIIMNGTSSALNTAMSRSWKTAGIGIPANFIANHDVGRMVGSVGGRYDIRYAKLGHSLLGIMPGVIFNYYGDEVGQAVPINKNGDPDIRLHVEWGDSYVTKDPLGAVDYDHDKTYPYPDVATQLKDENSILSHVRRVNKLRRQFPQIARGQNELIDKVADEANRSNIALISKKTENSTIYLAINASAEREYDYDFSALEGYKPVAEVAVEGHSTYKGTSLHLAKGGIVVLAKEAVGA